MITWREAGDVCYADVPKDGMGMVEYLRKEDMNMPCKLDGETKFRLMRVKPPTSEFIQREAPVMAIHGLGLGLGPGAVTLHTKSRGSPHYFSPFRA